MCGIAGFVHHDGRPADAGVAERMIAMLRHRGPDGSGVLVRGQAVLAHARLSIIDLVGGAQPMSNEDGTIWITFNGEIYNYLELREELEPVDISSDAIRHRSDRPRVRGVRSRVPRFVQRAVRVRDLEHGTIGQPVPRARSFRQEAAVLRHAGDVFVFASEMKAVLAHPAVKSRTGSARPRSDPDVLVHGAAADDLRRRSRAAAGTLAQLRSGEVPVQRYWQPERTEEPGGPHGADYAEELRALLVDAVRLRMLRSDVPVGAYLSGGIDSTVIAAHRPAAHGRSAEDVLDCLRGSGVRREPLPARGRSSTSASRIITRRCAAQRTSVAAFPRSSGTREQPLVRTAPAPLFLLSRLVREQGYKVVLTGEGSDEVLGGYDIFKEAKVRRFCAAQSWHPPAAAAAEAAVSVHARAAEPVARLPAGVLPGAAREISPTRSSRICRAGR